MNCSPYGHWVIDGAIASTRPCARACAQGRARGARPPLARMPITTDMAAHDLGFVMHALALVLIPCLRQERLCPPAHVLPALNGPAPVDHHCCGRHCCGHGPTRAYGATPRLTRRAPPRPTVLVDLWTRHHLLPCPCPRSCCGLPALFHPPCCTDAPVGPPWAAAALVTPTIASQRRGPPCDSQ